MWLILIVLLAGAPPEKIQPPAVTTLLFENSDFESGTLKNWTTTGDAFSRQPTMGENPYHRGRGKYANIQGEYWIGSYEKFTGKPGEKPGTIQGDQPTGTLQSVPFVIGGDLIAFLIGGGQIPGQEYVALEVDGEEVRWATGRYDETMELIFWYVREWKGQTARIVVKDLVAIPESWGHINVDFFHYLNFD